MSTPGSKVLSKMLDRLLAGLMSGPNMNCRPHNSRQRVDLTALAKLHDIAPEEILKSLLGTEKSAKVVARAKLPRKSSIDEGEKSLAEKAWIDQSSLLTKLRLIADDARTYENDTGVHALSIGFPILSLPPGSFAGGPRNSTKRILAPIAFIPITMSLKGGATPSVEFACRGEGADRVVPNTALLSWIEQQTGRPQKADAFDDEQGTDPWREIAELAQHVAKAMQLAEPTLVERRLKAADPNAGDIKGVWDGISAPRQVPCEETVPDPFLSSTALSEKLSRNSDSKSLSAAVKSSVAYSQSSDSKTVPDPVNSPTKIESNAKNVFEPSPITIPNPTTEKGVGDSFLEMPSHFTLSSAPRGDVEAEQPAILLCAVVGLFPTAHQGLLRDTRAILDETAPMNGPIQNFLSSGIDFDLPPTPMTSDPQTMAKSSSRAITTERLAAAADPCQARAVALAREAAGLVVHGPPGTGKSQTITNIIADHLARGQRVLLVCDKRTALDVVADRLEHMGLRRLCGIVHDPQRDQRDLYRSIHEQLDELPEAKLSPRAEALLQKSNIELQELHDELSSYHKSLMDAAPDGGMSFHQLMGRWMAEHTDVSVKLDAVNTAHITVEQLETKRAALAEILQRAQTADFSRNVWARCAGISLADFLTRQMAALRLVMDRIVNAADAADKTADPRIVTFNDSVPLPQQAHARGEVAEQLAELFPKVMESGLAELATKDLAAVADLRTRINAFAPQVQLLRQGPLDAELLSFSQPPPTLPEIKRNLLTLQQYRESAKKWFGFFAFGINGEAAKLLKQYALPRTPENADRVQRFLIGLEARISLSNLMGGPGVFTDEQIERYLNVADKWLALLKRIGSEDALRGIGPALSKMVAFQLRSKPVSGDIRVGMDPQHAAPDASEPPAATSDSNSIENFLEGLELSAARADAIVHLTDLLNASTLFAPAWLSEFEAGLRRAKLAHETVSALSEKLDSLEGVLRVRDLRGTLPPELLPAMDQLLSQVIDANQAFSALNQTVLTAEITRRLQSNPALLACDAHRIESNFARYRELDSQKKLLVRDAISHLWVSKQKDRLLSGTGSRLNSTGADLRRRLTSRGERAMRLRQVIAISDSIEGGDPLFDLCPVWMASPETVAQIFPRKTVFDVIIFDEASQCRLEEALPVLTRGRRVVIAGDPNQLPPTRFFESGLVQSEDEDPETEQQLFDTQQGEVEDLLGAALNLAIQHCYLDVHYRSRNSDLIEFSNRNFYASRLQAIPGHPSNRTKFSPLTLYRVDGTYNKRQNEAEADRVVQIVRDLLKRAAPPSIGIACLNLPQRDLIVEKLDELSGEDADFAKRLAAARTRRGQGSFEGLFVKNLENVQGDERDDIIISTTYGPDTKGKFYRRFGPLGMAGGGRRLNVLVTRARNEVHLVTSIPVESYRSLPAVPDGQAATGAWLLFAYLKYAEELAALYRGETAKTYNANSDVEQNASAVESTVNVLPTKSPSLFSQKLGDTLAVDSSIGSDVHWGNDGFCVDLALHHPARPGDVTIGVLCDGCRYLAAEDVVEWDIFRTGILTDQGWTLKRVWTPHFFRDPQGQEKEIRKAAADFVAAEKPADALPTINPQK